MSQARNLFRAAYNGQPNVMTPILVGYHMTRKGTLAVEVSASPDGSQYGVTVLDGDGTKRHDLSSAFSTRAEADTYVRSLRHG